MDEGLSFLANCTYQHEADEFIKTTLNEASASEKRQIQIAFMGDLFVPGSDPLGPMAPPPLSPGYRLMSGGAASPKQHALMQLADSFHDCRNRRNKALVASAASPASAKSQLESRLLKERTQYIFHCVGADLPVVTIQKRLTQEQIDKIPADKLAALTHDRRIMRSADVESWDKFLEIMTTNPTLDFDGVPSDNSLCGKDFMSGMFKYATGNFEDKYKEYLYECAQRTEEDELDDLLPYTNVDASRRYARNAGGSVYSLILEEILLEEMKNATLPRASAQPNKSLRKLDRGSMKNVEVWCPIRDDSFRRKVICVTQIADLCRCMRVAFGRDARFMPDCGDMIVQSLLGIKFSYRSFVKYFEVDGYADPQVHKAFQDAHALAQVSWSSWYCDATLMDSKEAIDNLQFDDTPTGKVFHDDSPVQIELSPRNSIPSPRRYSYSLTSLVSSVEGEPLGTEIHREVSLAYAGRSNVVGPVESWVCDGVEVDHSATEAAIEIERLAPAWIAGRTGPGEDREGAVALAIKRAGDWGMVKHCKDNNMVFVTTDRFAALYAIFMDVPLLFLHTSQPEATFAQYSFALYAVDSTTPSVTQPGGGSGTLATWVALIAVVAACACA